jgi:hypothetical protein
VRTLREPATAGAVLSRLGHLADRDAGRHPTWASIAGKATRPVSLAVADLRDDPAAIMAQIRRFLDFTRRSPCS